MPVSAAIRRALKKSKQSQTTLGVHWGTTPQVINNKMRLERWTGEELAQVAQFTGGKLAILYPDGEQIEIEPSAGADAPAKPRQPKQPEKPKQAKAPAKPKKAKAPAKKKEPEQKPKAAPDVLEQQLSFFG